MFNVNGFKATLIQNNRTTTNEDYYDDQNKKEVQIKVCPYNVDQAIKFGEYTTPEATGYFITKAKTDVKEESPVTLAANEIAEGKVEIC